MILCPALATFRLRKSKKRKFTKPFNWGCEVDFTYFGRKQHPFVLSKNFGKLARRQKLKIVNRQDFETIQWLKKNWDSFRKQ